MKDLFIGILVLAVMLSIFVAVMRYRASSSYNEEIINSHMEYFKDSRTGLCFAVYASGHHRYSFSWVPCEAVEELLNK